MRLGAHIGVAGGVGKAPAVGKEVGCEAIQIFAKSPYIWKGAPIADDAAEAFRAGVRASGIASTAVHHGYLLNLANPDAGKRAMSRTAFLDELGRAEKLGVDYLIFHPGAHMGSGVEAGLSALVGELNAAFEESEGYHVRALLENSAGQGSTLCSQFRELQEVLRRLKAPARAGVALDTCHLFAGGRDFRTPEGYEALLAEAEASFGLDAVRAFHLNDAKAPLGSHLDRHENIGLGQIGAEGFRALVRDPRWSDRPGFLETPLGKDEYGAYVRDLATLRSLLENGPSPSSKPPAKARRRTTPK